MYEVISRINLKALVSILNDKSNPQRRPPLESRDQQWVQKHDCIVRRTELNEWNWRWATAIAILCDGYADTTGYYYGDAIGGLYV